MDTRLHGTHDCTVTVSCQHVNIHICYTLTDFFVASNKDMLEEEETQVGDFLTISSCCLSCGCFTHITYEKTDNIQLNFCYFSKSFTNWPKKTHCFTFKMNDVVTTVKAALWILRKWHSNSESSQPPSQQRYWRFDLSLCVAWLMRKNSQSASI